MCFLHVDSISIEKEAGKGLGIVLARRLLLGVTIDSIMSTSPLDLPCSGPRAGDVLLEVNGVRVQSSEHASRLI